MLIHTITIKTFNMQKNCLTFETLFLFYHGECNHKHKEIFFSINSIKKYSKKHNFSTAITYIQAKCNDFKKEAKPPKMQSTSYVQPWFTHIGFY